MSAKEINESRDHLWGKHPHFYQHVSCRYRIVLFRRTLEYVSSCQEVQFPKVIFVLGKKLRILHQLASGVVGKWLQPFQIHTIQKVQDWVVDMAARHHPIDEVEYAYSCG